MAALLDWWETIKQVKHGNHCNDQQKHFSLFVLSVDVMISMEALAIITPLIPNISEEREEPLSYVWGWINDLIAIAVVRSYPRIIRGAQHPIPLQYREPDWDQESVIKLAG